MQRELRFTDEADRQLKGLESNPAKKGPLKQVLKTLGLLETNVRHPGLNTHEYQSLLGAKGERVWEAYAQNQTSGAYRVFFHYGPDEVAVPPGKADTSRAGSSQQRGGGNRARIAVLTIVAITPHP